jgi:integrase
VAPLSGAFFFWLVFLVENLTKSHFVRLKRAETGYISIMKGMRPLSDEEIVKVLDGFVGRHALRDKALFVLGIKSGLRISELLSLRVGDVYQYGRMLDRVTIEKRNTKGKHKSKNKPLHPDAKKILKQLIEQDSPHPDAFLFQSQKGANKAISRNHAWWVFNRVFDLEEIPGKKGTHCMRKTVAKKVWEKDKDIRMVQKVLDHARVDTSFEYLSFEEGAEDDAILDL